MVKWRNRETRDNLFKVVDDNAAFVVYDLETTGLKADRDKIIQMSAIKCQIIDGKISEISRLNEYINPEIPIPPKITEITGITNDDVFNKKTEVELFPIIKEFFGERPVISGYNVAKFDNAFMKNLYERNGVEFSPLCTVDVFVMAKDNINNKDTENFKLGTVANLYGVDDGITFHNSMDDVVATSRLLATFYMEYKSTYEQDEVAINHEPTAQEGKKLVDNITRISFWEGFKGFSRIYVETNLGDFFYDIRKQLWAVSPKKNPYTIDEVDMEVLRWKVFQKCGVKTEEDFVKANTPHKSDKPVKIETINSLKYWEKTNDASRTIRRIYIGTDVGDFYFDIDMCQWVSKATAKVDMEELKQKCYAKAGVANEEEFAAFR